MKRLEKQLQSYNEQNFTKDIGTAMHDLVINIINLKKLIIGYFIIH